MHAGIPPAGGIVQAWKKKNPFIERKDSWTTRSMQFEEFSKFFITENDSTSDKYINCLKPNTIKHDESMS